MIQKSSIRILLGIGAALFMLQVQATQQIEANIAKVPVSDQSQRTQERALKSALNEVMVKLSGSTSVLQNPGVKAALRTPQAFLKSYRFAYQDGQTLYVAEFDKTKLTNLLKRERLALWGERRPETLIWLASENEEGERFIIDEGHHTNASQLLLESAEKRGVPVLFPLMDLTDSENISIYDVWGRFVQTLTQASERYMVDNVIGARIYKNQPQQVPSFPTDNVDTNISLNAPEASSVVTEVNNNSTAGNELSGDINSFAEIDETYPMQETSDAQPFTMNEFTQHLQRAREGDYALDWVFIGNNKVTYGSIYADEPEELTAELIDAYANYLSSQYAVVPGANLAERIQIEISVANINSLSKYAHANAYLNSLSVIENAMLVEQTGSVATFRLTLLGTEDDLLNTVRLESKLQPVVDAYGQVVEGYTFYWNE